jgi:tetratricopeptide (TPR) repeat protein
MAAALYETLDSADHAALSSHLEACPVCRKQQEAFKQLLTVLPQTAESLPCDLVGLVRARIAEETPRSGAFGWLPAWGAPVFAGACALMLGFSLYFLGPEMGPLNGDTATTTFQEASIAAAPAAPSEAGVLEEARLLVAANRHDEAASILRTAAQESSDASVAGQAQRALAALTYEHFRLYDVAFQEYMKLRNQFGPIYRQDPESIDRFELLTEEWENRFQALAAIDAARDRVYAEPFRQLESVMAGNPGRHVAEIALREMQALVRADREGYEDDLNVLEAVRQRCVDPIAVAQVNLHLGEMYCDAHANEARARALYQEVVDAGAPVLAERAGQALARLDSMP